MSDLDNFLVDNFSIDDNLIECFRLLYCVGASDGVAHLFTPRWETLLDPVVWLEAGTQIFFSLGLAFGGLIAFSSYNPANNNCYRDAILVSMTNCGTSMFAGVVVFSVIGFKATATYDRCTLERERLLLLWANQSVDDLPQCDLERELENVSYPRKISTIYMLLTLKFAHFFSLLIELECVRHWSSLYHLHRSHQSIPLRTALGRSVLSDAFHAGHWFTVRHTRGRGNLLSGHEIIPEYAKGINCRGTNCLLANPDMHIVIKFIP